MLYKGYILYRHAISPQFSQMLDTLSSSYTRINFKTITFEEFRLFCQESFPAVHILIIELSDNDEPDLWFSLVMSLLAKCPYLKVIFVFIGKMERNLYYMNQIPFTYLIPEKFLSALLPVGIDKAVTELDLYGAFRHFRPVSPDPRLLSAVYFCTDNLINKGKKGCHIHYPDGSTEYTRQSMKSIIPKLPANFIQVHKSYVINMQYYGRRIQKNRASGNSYDEYILIQNTSSTEEILIPVGPKYRGAVMDYFMDKYGCMMNPYLSEKEAD